MCKLFAVMCDIRKQKANTKRRRAKTFHLGWWCHMWSSNIDLQTGKLVQDQSGSPHSGGSSRQSNHHKHPKTHHTFLRWHLPLPKPWTLPQHHLLSCGLISTHCRADQILTSERVTANPVCSTLSGSSALNPWSHHRNRRPFPPSRARAELQFSAFQTKEFVPVFDERGGRFTTLPADATPFKGFGDLFGKH